MTSPAPATAPAPAARSGFSGIWPAPGGLALAVTALATLSAFPAVVSPLQGQDRGGDDPVSATAVGPGLSGEPTGDVPVDTTGMGVGPWSRLSMLYEVTIFNVDVLEVEIRVDPETAERLAGLGGEGRGPGTSTDGSPAQAMADAVVTSPASIIRTRFCRDVSVDRFLSGAVENLEHATQAGHVSELDADRIAGEIGDQFAALEGRGFRDGDTLWYEIRGDSLVMVVQGRDGTVLLRDVAEGEGRRSALLGGYLAPASDFRDKLLRSLGPGA